MVKCRRKFRAPMWSPAIDKRRETIFQHESLKSCFGRARGSALKCSTLCSFRSTETILKWFSLLSQHAQHYLRRVWGCGTRVSVAPNLKDSKTAVDTTCCSLAPRSWNTPCMKFHTALMVCSVQVQARFVGSIGRSCDRGLEGAFVL